MKTVAIIPAGGRGKRMGEATPKQYLSLSGMPILVYTLRIFQYSLSIDEIILAVPKADITDVRKNIVERYGLSKVFFIIPGGKERQDSVRNALRYVNDEAEIIVDRRPQAPVHQSATTGRLRAGGSGKDDLMKAQEQALGYLRTLGLQGIVQGLDELVNDAESRRSSYLAFLNAIFSAEIDFRVKRRVERNMTGAHFPVHKGLEDFDFGRVKGIGKSEAVNLLDCRWIDKIGSAPV